MTMYVERSMIRVQSMTPSFSIVHVMTTRMYARLNWRRLIADLDRKNAWSTWAEIGQLSVTDISLTFCEVLFVVAL